MIIRFVYIKRKQSNIYFFTICFAKINKGVSAFDAKELEYLLPSNKPMAIPIIIVIPNNGSARTAAQIDTSLANDISTFLGVGLEPISFIWITIALKYGYDNIQDIHYSKYVHINSES